MLGVVVATEDFRLVKIKVSTRSQSNTQYAIVLIFVRMFLNERPGHNCEDRKHLLRFMLLFLKQTYCW